jgi:hypothetical protein
MLLPNILSKPHKSQHGFIAKKAIARGHGKLILAWAISKLDGRNVKLWGVCDLSEVSVKFATIQIYS